MPWLGTVLGTCVSKVNGWRRQKRQEKCMKIMENTPPLLLMSPSWFDLQQPMAEEQYGL